MLSQAFQGNARVSKSSNIYILRMTVYWVRLSFSVIDVYTFAIIY